MITFDKLSHMFAVETKKEYCLEIGFSVLGSEKFSSCWMGKQFDEEKQQDIYWYGLTEDGENAYEYISFEEMSDACVFDGRNLKEIWNKVELWSVDGAEPD